MTPDNMPVLWLNCLGMLQTEIARRAWVWFAESHPSAHQYQADTFALEVDALVLSLRPLVGRSACMHGASDEVVTDLEAFILMRHANLRLRANSRPSYICTAG